MENTMKNITIIATLLATLITTSAQAEEIYTPRVDETRALYFTPMALVEPKTTPSCTTGDAIIGVAAGVTAAVFAGVATVAAMPVVGAGAAAGGVVGWAGAFSAPFLTNATASVVAATVVIGGPLFSAVGFYTTCVVRTVMDK